MGRKRKKPVDIPRSFTVIVDTREKNPLSFSSASILGVKYQALKTGDYSVEGFEDKLCIERKMSANEIATNLFQKRFHAELDRMLAYDYRFILLESSMQKIIEYPKYEELPYSIISKIKVSGAYILKMLNRIQVKYGVHIAYCGNSQNAAWVAANIMSEVVNLEYGKGEISTA